MNRFRDFLSTRGCDLEPELIAHKDLDLYISRFLLSLRKKDGQMYEPDSLTSFHRAIARYLKEKIQLDIVRHEEFRTSREVLSGKRVESKENGLGNKPNKSENISPKDEEKLWSTGALGNDNPVTLQKNHLVLFWKMFRLERLTRAPTNEVW